MRSQRSLDIVRVLILCLCLGLVTGCSRPGRAAENSPASGASGGASTCQPKNVRIEPTEESSSRVRMVLTNTGSHPCTLHGPPAVALFGPNDAMFGPAYYLPEATLPRWVPGLVRETFPTVTLRQGQQAHSSIQYLDDQGGVNRIWSPTRMVVTLPDTTGWLATRWPGKPLARQNAASHPATWVGPVLPGATGPLTLDVE